MDSTIEYFIARNDGKCQNLRRGDVVTTAQLRLTDDSSQSKSGAGGDRAPIYYDYAREGLRNQRDRRRRQGLGGGLGGLGGLVGGSGGNQRFTGGHLHL